MATTEELRGEATFLPSAFRSSHIETDLRAFAKRFQTLLIMEPGTIPNLVDAGVGIGMYLSEFADSSTVMSLTERINDQVGKYLPNSLVAEIIVEILSEQATGAKIMAVKCRMYTPIDEKTTFALTFKDGSTMPVKDNVVSDFYF